MKKLLYLVTAFLVVLWASYGFTQTKITIATGGTGGVYYPYGGTMAEIISKYIPGVTATAEVTGASVENVRLVGLKKAELGLAMNDTVYQAYKGEGKFADGKIDSLRTVFQMYPNLYHIVTLKKYPIHRISDLKGKKVSVGAPGSGTELKTSQVLPALGIQYKDIKVYRLSFAENTTQLKDGTIEVGIWSVAPPTSSIIDLATTHEIRFIPFSKEEIETIEKAYPYYTGTVIPKNTYKGQTEDVPTIAVWNSVVCHKDLPEDLVYKITKAIFENKKMLVDTHKIAEFTSPEVSATKSPIPVHPGALKYYKEIKVIK
ncbi:MAG: TAXI family TRAP transporter solute-binding subunit [Deltaproteobacteria bacterium]|nr:TAXI family TRAP transporter solute-binding subunit [Deltaproteobacteria bacterium]